MKQINRPSCFRRRGHDRIPALPLLVSLWMMTIVGLVEYPEVVCITATSVKTGISRHGADSISQKRRQLRLLPEEKSSGRGATDGGNGNDRDQQRDPTHDDSEHQQQHVTSYAQRHPNNYYYYSNGDRVSSNTKSAYSYYDYNDDDSYYSRNGNNNNNSHRQRIKLYRYTTKLSDVYWCLLIALGWTIWMIHSIASLRQQHYNTMLSLSERGIHDTTINMTTTMMMMPTPNEDTMRIFRTNYASLLLVRGHVLDIIPKPNAVFETDDGENDDAIQHAPVGYTVVIDYVVERQMQHPPTMSPTKTTTASAAGGIPDASNDVTTLPTIDHETIPPNEFIQIRKHFETTQSNLEVGFGNVELLVLPNDPMCSILKYDYDEYLRQEERIQRVIALEQCTRNVRRKKRHQERQHRRAVQSKTKTPAMTSETTGNLTLSPIADDLKSEALMTPADISSPTLKIDTNLQDEPADDDFKKDNNDDDDLCGFDVCCTYCDWNYYDQYQWKRLSLFFAVLLVLASIIGTGHVVSRMDPTKKYLGWISFWIGLLLLFPAALYVHKIMIACHRWSESEPEKQGYIVQSSTITSFNNNNDIDTLEPINSTYRKTTANTSIPTGLPNMMTLADACMRPSYSEMMDDICDPHCSNHTLTTTTANPLITPKSRTTIQTEFSYMVPELSGCYFINYPKKDHHRHHRSSMNQLDSKKRLRKPKHTSNGIHTGATVVGSRPPPPNMTPNSTVVQNVIVAQDEFPNAVQQPDQHDSASSATASCIVESESSVSSISSNDDPTMQRLSVWNSMAYHDI